MHAAHEIESRKRYDDYQKTMAIKGRSSELNGGCNAVKAWRDVTW